MTQKGRKIFENLEIGNNLEYEKDGAVDAKFNIQMLTFRTKINTCIQKRKRMFNINMYK